MTETHEKLLPIANVGRIMKQILPPNAKISKEAKERMQECVSEFICFVTSEASDRCQRENRRTVNGDDICWALGSLGFDNYSEVMMRYLDKLREFHMHRATHGIKETLCNKENERTIDSTSIQSSGTASNNWIEFGILESGGSNSAKDTYRQDLWKTTD